MTTIDPILQPLVHLDLFSGIGGFALAAQRAGFTTIGFSEVEPYACKILARHWPDVPNHGDIRTMRGAPCDLVTGGFPCQPFSLAGKRGGASDDRALWPEMLRVIAESKPRWVLGENVPGIINMELDNVLSDLEGIGYSAWPIVIPACAVDARHRRDRVWIVAHCADNRTGRREQLTEGGKGAGHVANTEEGRIRRGRASRNSGQPARRREAVAYAMRQCSNVGKQFSQPPGSNESPNHCWWPTEPELGRVAHGIPNRSHRLKGLGNAIVPQVAEIILREMARSLEEAA